MWNVVTLDGYFEGERNWDLPWHEQVWGEELEQFSLEQLRSAAMLVFGRVSMKEWRSLAHGPGKRCGLHEQAPKGGVLANPRCGGWNKHDAREGRRCRGSRGSKRGGDGNMFIFGSSILSKA